MEKYRCPLEYSAWLHLDVSNLSAKNMYVSLGIISWSLTFSRFQTCNYKHKTNWLICIFIAPYSLHNSELMPETTRPRRVSLNSEHFC